MPGKVAAWRKSTVSNSGACVEAAGNWRKSSRSSHNGACAEVGQDGTGVFVRDTLDRDGPVLAFSAAAWTAFCRRLAG